MIQQTYELVSIYLRIPSSFSVLSTFAPEVSMLVIDQLIALTAAWCLYKLNN